MTENKTNWVPIICGLAILFVFLSFIGSKNEPPTESWQMREIHQVAANVEDFIITYEATGLIKSRKIENGKYTIVVNEYMWLNQLQGNNRNLIRYALKELAKQQGIERTSIIGDNTKQEYQI